MTTRRCVVLVPYATHVEPACDHGLRALEARGYAVRRYPSSAAVDRTRCDMATQALAEGFDELLWVDSDIAFDPDALERLRSHDLPVVAAIYPKKAVQQFAMSLVDPSVELVVGEQGGLYEARGVGAGFLLVQRAVFEDVQRHFSLPVCYVRYGTPCVPYFLPMVVADGDDYSYLGEDYAFCERARQAGYKIMIDTTIRLGHVGKYIYSWEDAGQAIVRVTGATFKTQP